MMFESNEPITYGKYKEILKKMMGLTDLEDYELRQDDHIITDDEMIIDDSRLRDPIFDLKLNVYLEEDKKVYYYVPKPKTFEDKVKDIKNWIWKFKDDTITFNTEAKLFSIQPEEIND